MSSFCFFFFLIIVKWNKRYLSHNVSVSVAGGQVQRRVVSSVHDVDARPSHDEHVHHVGAALPAGPVERAEAVVITAKRQTTEIKHWTSGPDQAKTFAQSILWQTRDW